MRAELGDKPLFECRELCVRISGGVLSKCAKILTMSGDENHGSEKRRSGR